MSAPSSAREALLVEALGDAADLLHRVEALQPSLAETCQALHEASTTLRDDLACLERQMATITEGAKKQAVLHIVARTDEAARHAIDLQSRAMADAARVALGSELGSTMQRLQVMLQPLLEARERWWETWLTHGAAAVVASAATWAIAVYVGPR